MNEQEIKQKRIRYNNPRIKWAGEELVVLLDEIERMRGLLGRLRDQGFMETHYHWQDEIDNILYPKGDRNET